MLFYKPLLAFSLAVVTTAFLVPVGQPDGLYEFFVDAAGREIHRRMNVTVTKERNVPDFEALEKQSKWPNTDLVPMPRPKRRCGCGHVFNMNHAGCDAAVADLRSQIERTSVYASQENPLAMQVAFLCNGASEPWPITADNFDHFRISLVWISRDCGTYVAGTVEEEEGGPRYGYMIHWPELDFCGKAMLSKKTSC
ncbi:hypothetical protein DL98DRAFT_596492 [Cadophora sp. DSE1049]|nr:hypothetical protein DL98DRAFT_596492 [Cadophora sp. DSE1049]